MIEVVRQISPLLKGGADEGGGGLSNKLHVFVRVRPILHSLTNLCKKQFGIIGLLCYNEKRSWNLLRRLGAVSVKNG